MEIRAYNELYIENAQFVLGHAVDYAVETLAIDADVFGTAFCVSSISKQFAKGNPTYVAGTSGPELARYVMDEVRLTYPEHEDVMYLDKSPSYWAGFCLAYYQWYRDVSFTRILEAVKLSEMIRLYPKLHEMDILQFVDVVDQRMHDTYQRSRLREYRMRMGLSQSELSASSGVPLRQIQLFEQGQRDINKTSAITVLMLSKALRCEMSDLIETVPEIK